MQTSLLLDNPFTRSRPADHGSHVLFSSLALAKCQRHLGNISGNLDRITQLLVESESLQSLQIASKTFAGAPAFGPAEVHLVTESGRYTSMRLQLECAGPQITISTQIESLWNTN